MTINANLTYQHLLNFEISFFNIEPKMTVQLESKIKFLLLSGVSLKQKDFDQLPYFQILPLNEIKEDPILRKA